MLKRLIEYLGWWKQEQPDFYRPATRRHMVIKVRTTEQKQRSQEVTLRGPDRILETSVYDPKDDMWYVQAHEKFSEGNAYTNNEIAAWTYLPIRRLATLSEKDKN
jgi:hypothetical protein